jgi:chitinase
MRIVRFLLLALFVLAGELGYGQGTAPTFRFDSGNGAVTLPGRDPARGGTTVIPTMLIAVRLQFESTPTTGKPVALDATEHVQRVLRSPVFSNSDF